MTAADAEIDRLYALPLGEFTAARNDLAKALRTNGDREGADDVKALEKPSVAAWAVNQLARGDAATLRELLTAGERLRDAQAAVLGGGSPAKLREASAAERAVVARLVAKARDVLQSAGHSPTDATLDRIAETLRAAAVDDDARALLERGRLTRELEATGFGPAPGALPPRAPNRREDEREARRRERAETVVRERKAEVSELAASHRDAQRRADDARRAADEAQKTADRELARLEKAQEQLERAERDLAALA